MKNVLLILPLLVAVHTATQAQSPAKQSSIRYQTILTLQPGEQFQKYLSCWWFTKEKQIASLVIQQPDGTYSVIENGVRRDNLKQEQLMLQANCNKLSPYAVPGNSHLQFARLLANGRWNIRSSQQDFGTYDKILFMRERDDRFVALLLQRKNDTDQYYYLDASGKKIQLAAKPEDLITNQDLSKVAVLLASKEAMPIENVNKMSREEQIAYFEKMRTTDISRQVWFTDQSSLTVSKKSRLLFDASGRHFVEIQARGLFYVDGKEFKRNISGGSTLLFVNKQGDSWAYYFNMYLTFMDNYTIQEAISPFLTQEDGKEYLNWYKIEKDGDHMVLKQGSRLLGNQK